MKAVVYTTYGPPEVLQIKEIDKPEPEADEVLVKVHATTVTPVDCIFRKGDSFFAKLYTGLTKPKNPILGSELSGEVEAVGAKVTRFKKGDLVFGTGSGTHAEYVCLPEDGALALKPGNLTMQEAAALPYGALTALPFLRDAGQIRRGQKVLINGASGSIGSYAVQLARHYEAEVTAVCSTSNVEMVKSLGADKVVDYRKEDFTQSGETYDVIFDTVGKSSFSRCKRALADTGIYLTTVMSLRILFQKAWTSKRSGKKAGIEFTGLRPPDDIARDFVFIKELAEAGEIKAVIDRRYPLEHIAEAYKYVEAGHKKGNVIITMKALK